MTYQHTKYMPKAFPQEEENSIIDNKHISYIDNISLLEFPKMNFLSMAHQRTVFEYHFYLPEIIELHPIQNVMQDLYHSISPVSNPIMADSGHHNSKVPLYMEPMLFPF